MQGRKYQRGARSAYPDSLRRAAARLYLESDLSYLQVAEHYQLPNKYLVKEWVKWYRTSQAQEHNLPPAMTPEEQSQLLAYQKRVQELEDRLRKANLQVEALQRLIELAEEELKIDIVKKPGSKPSKK